ncbi:RNA polymerase sigma-70 factor [Foetidibacter luteolus]|uniref:RNA polymerase sigma-70 factor n=1 Tax=Foetidibacter luteolus TaxID=2608880 RepID=UPI001A983623|nr:RNA polymerase sigma-70 factor [Foetidibacter luteolus]
MRENFLYQEQDLLARLAAGDETALTVIYRQYWKPLFISAYNVLKDKAVCEDLLQEIFLQLWAKRERLEIQESLQAYLFAATRYQVFAHIKKCAGREAALDKLAPRLIIVTAEEPMLQKDLNRQVEKVIAGLPEKCRQVYRLSREAHLSHKEIAEKLSISPKTVENQLTIALHRLRVFLKEAMAVVVAAVIS